MLMQGWLSTNTLCNAEAKINLFSKRMSLGGDVTEKMEKPAQYFVYKN